MQESPFIELIMQRYIEQGSRETYVKNILSVLSKRFQFEDVQPIKEALESIVDLDRMTELHDTSIDIPSINEFLQEVKASEE